MIRFYISPAFRQYFNEIAYTLQLWAKNQKQEIRIESSSSPDTLNIGPGKESHFQVHASFSSADPGNWQKNGFICDPDGRPDYLASAFHLVNCTHEYNPGKLDDLGRFPHTESLPFRFRTAHQNKVQECFDAIAVAAGVKPRTEPAGFFLSHDIDIVNGAYIEDGFYVLKRGRVDLFLGMLFRLAMRRPDWLNMDKIMNLESEYDCKSIFFWIVNKGRINAREINADYSFQSQSIRRNFNAVIQNKFDNGIHKSLSQETFQQEFQKYGSLPFSNRYHYLKFNLPQAYHDIEDAKLKLDASLGFAEQTGFRNSYGLPFNPYNFQTGKPFSFVEVPLHIMDRTYFQYKKSSLEAAAADVIHFFETNRTNCVISVLWHNNFFTNYKFKGYLDLYKKILSYIRDNNFRTLSAEEIVKNYSIVK